MIGIKGFGLALGEDSLLVLNFEELVLLLLVSHFHGGENDGLFLELLVHLDKIGISGDGGGQTERGGLSGNREGALTGNGKGRDRGLSGDGKGGLSGDGKGRLGRHGKRGLGGRRKGRLAGP